jgi:hypothetical protein
MDLSQKKFILDMLRHSPAKEETSDGWFWQMMMVDAHHPG